MSITGRRRRFFLAGALILCLLAGSSAVAIAAAPQSVDAETRLEQADKIKTSDHEKFMRMLDQLRQEQASLPSRQRWYVRFLYAWQVAFAGHYPEATPLLKDIIRRAPDASLRFRAAATLVNILGIGRHYEKAFEQLNHMLDQLPEVTDQAARFQGLGEASQLLISAGQYDLALAYADRMLEDPPAGEGQCKGLYLKAHAHFRSGKMKADDPLMRSAIDACVKEDESVYANSLRTDLASFEMSRGHAADAIQLLQKHYPKALQDSYPRLISAFQALLGQGYLQQGELATAEKFAVDAVHTSIKGEYTKPLSLAYKVLYEVEQRQGNYQAALGWHEKYMESDKGYLTDVSARALAFQVVNQQVQARKMQVEGLNKQNRILQLKQALDRKEVETSRLYIVLLLTVLVSIGLWVFRLKRSQLRFMHLARYDSLTGIFNRKHFLDETQRALKYAQRAERGACLILIDLDHFKQINDTLGHSVGDQVLKHAVMVCQMYLRSVDIFGRLGGEEFGILLPECKLEQGTERAELIRRAIETMARDSDSRPARVSASFGVASVQRSGYELRQLMIDADEALYRAKRGGRNQVAIARVERVEV